MMNPDKSNMVRVGATIAAIILVVVLGLVTYFYVQAPVETFAPDGSHIGDFQIGSTWYSIFQLIFGTQIDKAWVDTLSIIQYLILPFVAIMILVFSIFEEIRFFRYPGWFNWVMALIVALVVSSSGILVRMMRIFLQLAGGLAIVLFGGILLIGIFVWWLGKFHYLGSRLTESIADASDAMGLRIQCEEMLNKAQGVMRSLRDSEETTKEKSVKEAYTKLRKSMDRHDIPQMRSDLNDLEYWVKKYVHS
jgi:hypothetical protein